jgi:hypothetical protein
MQNFSFFVERAKKAFGICIIDLTKARWEKTLFRSLNPPFVQQRLWRQYAGEDSFHNLLGVAKDKLGARTAIIEPYISTDWNSERSAVYARAFMESPQFANRIHFFRCAVSYGELYQITKKLQKAYIGYTVIRPLQAFRVGDTILRSPWVVPKSSHDLVHCLSEFSVSLLGNRLTVRGMPFCQQDTTVGVCASADLWMLARYFNKLGEIARHRPAEITTLATGTISLGPAREGLGELQMADALRRMGLNPVVLPAMNDEEAREFVYSCIESELPVIVGVPEHVVVVIGHDYSSPVTDQMTSLGEAVGSFIVHNDASGPYQKRMVGKTTKSKQQMDLLTLDGEEVDLFMVPFPARVHMNWKDVQGAANLWIEHICDYVGEALGIDRSLLWRQEERDALVIRMYLRLSSDFKNDLTNPKGGNLRNEKIIARYRCMHMPKYIWVVELASRADLKLASVYNRRIRGEIILDSTGNRHVPDETLMAFHLNGLMFAQEPQKKIYELIHADELPYSPLQRPSSPSP